MATSPGLTALLTVSHLLLGPVQADAQSGQPARDRPAQQLARTSPATTGRMSGRVVAADTGRPVRRARVVLAAPELPGGRGALTDGEGVFEFTELPKGRYTLTAGKSGFVSLAYGQRRPLQAGTPLQLNDGEHLRGLEFRLPRGSVVSGHVFDETGDPAPGAIVRVLRYQYAQGVRQLVPAGTAQTDDRGEYRVWGLNPGDYYVTATARGQDTPSGGPLGRGGRGLPPRGGPPPGDLPDEPRPEESGYAPTYYPGVDSIEAARAVTLGLSADVLGIDFNLLLVKTSRIMGRVTSVDGAPVSGNLVLTQEGTGSRPALGSALRARIQGDGAFTFANVPPGRYLLRARSNDRDEPRYASLPLTVSNTDLTGVSVIVAPGATISGSVSFVRSQLVAPDPGQFRLGAPSLDGTDIGPAATARVGTDGTFSMGGVAAGAHYLRAQTPRGWVLQSIVLDGRDITDTPLALRSGQHVANVQVVFTDRIAEISGTLKDEQGAAVNGYTVLAFPADAALWHPQARHIMTTRPDQTGTFQLRGLPPGEYLVAPIDPAEQGAWFDPAFLNAHSAGAARVRLGEGETKRQDLTVSVR
jgi:hypothetical protein